VLVIDAKQDAESVSQVLAEIAKLTDRPVRFLVNTHSDGDHVFGNQFFPNDVTIIAHENCRREFFAPQRDGTPSGWEDSELAPYVPSITFSKKMDIWLGGTKAELWYFGVGHTTGDAVVYVPSAKVAFLGDQIFAGRPQLIHSYKGGNSFEHVKTLSRMLESLDAEKFCSGHADVLGRDDIQAHIAEMTARQNKVKELKGRGKTLDEVKAEFPENESRLIESIYNEIER
jgi:glyoxylase-like metal-dependent hydrolase (beta-lactamase superfamily II)